MGGVHVNHLWRIVPSTLKPLQLLGLSATNESSIHPSTCTWDSESRWRPLRSDWGKPWRRPGRIHAFGAVGLAGVLSVWLSEDE